MSVRRYTKELILLGIQLFMFYLAPLFAGPADVMGLVFLIILMTFVLSVMMGIFSDKKVKFLYPMAVSVLFVPTVWIYYNETAMVHAVWYLVISAAGLLSGTLIHMVIRAVGGVEYESRKPAAGRSSRMRKILWRLAAGMLFLCVFWAIWLFGYHNVKRQDNIPSLKLIGEQGEAFAHKKLQGYHKEQLLEVWGESDDHAHEQEDVWYIDEDTALKVNYNGRGEVVAVSVFHYIE